MKRCMFVIFILLLVCIEVSTLAARPRRHRVLPKGKVATNDGCAVLLRPHGRGICFSATEEVQSDGIINQLAQYGCVQQARDGTLFVDSYWDIERDGNLLSASEYPKAKRDLFKDRCGGWVKTLHPEFQKAFRGTYEIGSAPIQASSLEEK